MNIVWYVSDLHACGIVRADVPCRAINKLPGTRATLHYMPMLSDLVGADVAIAQRFCTPEGLARFRAMKGRGVKIIYDIDDDLFCVPEHCKDSWPVFLLPQTRNSIVAMLNEADMVTVSTRSLAESMSRYTSTPIRVVENCIDLGHADWSIKHRPPKDDQVVIGWHGSCVHVGDIPIISDAIKTVLQERENVRLKLNGHFTYELFGDNLKGFGNRVTMDGWIDPMMLYRGLSEVDIGICPLIDNQFNRCKSNIKWLEYASVEVPCVVTPMPPYEMCEDGVDVLFARNKDEWVNNLLRLVDNASLRRTIGLAARVRAGREFDNSVVASKWMDAFRSVLGWKD